MSLGGVLVSAVAERQIQSSNPSAKHMLPNGLVLRCMVFQNETKEYTAECIDLDILVYGKNPYDAWRSLEGAIVGYLNVAFSGDTSGLVPRPSPLLRRARYHCYALRAGLTSGTRRSFLLNDWSPSPTLCKNGL